MYCCKQTGNNFIEYLHAKQLVHYTALACLVLVSVGLSGCEPLMGLRVKNKFAVRIVVSEHYQNAEQKPVAVVIGGVQPGKTATFPNAIQPGTDQLKVTFQDPRGRVIGHVDKTYDQGYSQSVHSWDITAGP